jgi:hypothetical protein
VGDGWLGLAGIEPLHFNIHSQEDYMGFLQRIVVSEFQRALDNHQLRSCNTTSLDFSASQSKSQGQPRFKIQDIKE